jgi:hypothetical protein
MLRRRLLASLAGAVTLLAAACGGGGAYTYESNKSAGVYFKIPKDWAEFDQEVLRALYLQAGKEPSGDGVRLLETIQWERAWDGSDDPNLDHLVIGNADAPFALVRVRRLLEDERPKVSLELLRNLVVEDYTERREEEKEALRRPSADSLVNPDFETLLEDELQPEGYRGVRQIFKLRDEGGNLDTVAMMALVDLETTRLITFVIHCNSRCFSANQDQLIDVIRSFTVKEV